MKNAIGSCYMYMEFVGGKYTGNLLNFQRAVLIKKCQTCMTKGMRPKQYLCPQKCNRRNKAVKAVQLSRRANSLSFTSDVVTEDNGQKEPSRGKFWDE